MNSNLGTLDRSARVILGLLLIAAPFISGMALFETAAATWITILIGLVLLATSALRFCPLYQIFGLRTCKR